MMTVRTEYTRLLLTSRTRGTTFSHLSWRPLTPPQEQLQGKSLYKGTCRPTNLDLVIHPASKLNFPPVFQQQLQLKGLPAS